MIDPEDNTYLYYQWYNEKPERVKILNGWDNETEEYRFYFMIGLTEFYIDEFMRVDI